MYTAHIRFTFKQGEITDNWTKKVRQYRPYNQMGFISWCHFGLQSQYLLFGPPWIKSHPERCWATVYHHNDSTWWYLLCNLFSGYEERHVLIQTAHHPLTLTYLHDLKHFVFLLVQFDSFIHIPEQTLPCSQTSPSWRPSPLIASLALKIHKEMSRSESPPGTRSLSYDFSRIPAVESCPSLNPSAFHLSNEWTGR